MLEVRKDLEKILNLSSEETLRAIYRVSEDFLRQEIKERNTHVNPKQFYNIERVATLTNCRECEADVKATCDEDGNFTISISGNGGAVMALEAIDQIKVEIYEDLEEWDGDL